MIAIDTNVLVRYLVADDPVQSAAARRLFNGLTLESPGFLGREAMIEPV